MVESDVSWTHYIDLNRGNLDSFFLYELIFESPDKDAQLDKFVVDKQFTNIIRHDPKAPVKLVKDGEEEEKMLELTHYFIRQESDDYLYQQNNTFSMQLIANCKIKPQTLVSIVSFFIHFIFFAKHIFRI